MGDTSKQKQLIEAQIQVCKAELVELQKTCCLHKRSEKMTGLIEEVERLGEGQLALETMTPDDAAAFTVQLEAVGAKLGVLYATCCTPTREPIYGAMFKSLSKIHLRLLRLQHGR
ncbi:hypothetical protein MXMO3_01381 [Maritalea myrionectae]|uniref:Uncharacterized protein n=1 Tax=Maritalea myrionectae TaxID=454601 RepID=A0A2R4MCY9_9HYPH|nr:hypothetical protein [Maritalea myrionectae]AVX03911.1 hypothetical protein MXMO3_01381 [Maritalea myrionectae]